MLRPCFLFYNCLFVCLGEPNAKNQNPNQKQTTKRKKKKHKKKEKHQQIYSIFYHDIFGEPAAQNGFPDADVDAAYATYRFLFFRH